MPHSVLINGDARPLETLVNDRTPLLSLSQPGRRSWKDLLDVTAIPALIAVIVAASGEQLLRIVIASNLYHYRWFFVQLMCMWSFLLASCLIAVRCLVFGKPLNLRSVPLKALLLLALLDLIHSVLLILPSGVVPFPLALILPQFTILVTIGLHRVTSRKCPSIGCCTGAVLVLLAPVIAVVPCWGSYQTCPVPSGVCGRSGTEILVNAAILTLAALPAAGSGVYKQSLLSYTVVPPELLMMLLSFIQLLAGFALGPLALRLQYVAATPIYASSQPGGDQLLPPFNFSDPALSDSLVGVILAPGPYRNNNDIFTNFAHGFSCLAGYDSEEGDVCEVLGLFMLLQVGLYVGSGFVLQQSLAQALKQTQSDYAIAAALAISMIIALLALTIFWSDLLPPYELPLCERKDIGLIAGLCAVLGLLFAHYGGFPPLGTVEVWARLEQAEQDLNSTPRGSENELRMHG